MNATAYAVKIIDEINNLEVAHGTEMAAHDISFEYVHEYGAKFLQAAIYLHFSMEKDILTSQKRR